jgi:hypothetical protein
VADPLEADDVVAILPDSRKVPAPRAKMRDIVPPDLGALRALLEPTIGPWPGAIVRPEGPAATLEASLNLLVGAAVEREEGLALYAADDDEGTGVALTVRRGKVQVLETPSYVLPHLVHALPDPADARLLGSTCRIRSVPEESAPPPGAAWYVVVKVPDVGRRLRLWRDTCGPLEDATFLDGDPLDRQAAVLDAFVAAWHDAMASGSSWLATFDLTGVARNVASALGVPYDIPDWQEKATTALAARLTPNPHHPWWTDSRESPLTQ